MLIGALNIIYSSERNKKPAMLIFIVHVATTPVVSNPAVVQETSGKHMFRGFNFVVADSHHASK